jgi:hypothetical protein
MNDLEIEAHRIGSTGPPVNGTAYVANMETEAVSLEPDGSEEDRPEYLRYVPYSKIHREEKFSLTHRFDLKAGVTPLPDLRERPMCFYPLELHSRLNSATNTLHSFLCSLSLFLLLLEPQPSIPLGKF